jgi:hypothetical protein
MESLITIPKNLIFSSFRATMTVWTILRNRKSKHYFSTSVPSLFEFFFAFWSLTFLWNQCKVVKLLREFHNSEILQNANWFWLLIAFPSLTEEGGSELLVQLFRWMTNRSIGYYFPVFEYAWIEMPCIGSSWRVKRLRKKWCFDELTVAAK